MFFALLGHPPPPAGSERPRIGIPGVKNTEFRSAFLLLVL
uniref:Uncharacterized protein n=1 Tax=Bartonella schoenbuchensis (strain DSM 13525 / NCTC 13165 / R1) TaxID=687861 RepID=E6Z171_BARSR|nr:hypothetical protein BARSC_190130 [Bartonella schoenbuchensis R1]